MVVAVVFAVSGAGDAADITCYRLLSVIPGSCSSRHSFRGSRHRRTFSCKTGAQRGLSSADCRLLTRGRGITWKEVEINTKPPFAEAVLQQCSDVTQFYLSHAFCVPFSFPKCLSHAVRWSTSVLPPTSADANASINNDSPTDSAQGPAFGPISSRQYSRLPLPHPPLPQ